MRGFLSVELRIGLDETKPPAERLNVSRLAGEECPARSYAVGLDIPAQNPGRIGLRIECNRIHKNVPAESWSQDRLHLHQVRGVQRTTAVTGGVHEIEHDHLSAYQVVIKPRLFVVVGGQHNVRKVTVAGSGRRAARYRLIPPAGEQAFDQCSSWHDSIL